jgi:hypothetical protein
MGHPTLVAHDERPAHYVLVVVAAAAVTATAVAGERVFARAVMARVAYVASAIARLVPLEVIELPRSAVRQWPNVTVMGIEAVIHMAIEAGMAVEPGAGPDEQAADKPIGSVVTVGGAVVRRVVKIPVGADGCNSNANRNLGLRIVGRADNDNSKSGYNQNFADRQGDRSIF